MLYIGCKAMYRSPGYLYAARLFIGTFLSIAAPSEVCFIDGVAYDARLLADKPLVALGSSPNLLPAPFTFYLEPLRESSNRNTFGGD